MSELLLAQPLASQKELLLAQVSNLQPRQTDKSSPSTYPVISKLSFSIYTLLLTKLCRLGPQCACEAKQCLRVGSLKLRVQVDSYKKSCMCRNFFFTDAYAQTCYFELPCEETWFSFLLRKWGNLIWWPFFIFFGGLMIFLPDTPY